MARWWIVEYPFRVDEDNIYLHHIMLEGQHIAKTMSFSQAASYVAQRATDVDYIYLNFVGRERMVYQGKQWREICETLTLRLEPHTDIQKRQRGDNSFMRYYEDATALAEMERTSDFYKIEFAASDSAGEETWWPDHWDVTIYSYGSGELHGYSEKSLADAIQNAQKEAKAQGGT